MSKCHSVIAAINKWDDSTITELHYAEKDGIELYSFLKEGLKFDEVQLLQGKEAIYVNIRKAVTSLVQDLGPDDLFLFYYSGHGIVRKATGDHCLLCHDAQRDDVIHSHDNGLLKESWLLEKFEGRPFHHLIITDACREALERSQKGLGDYVFDEQGEYAARNLGRAIKPTMVGAVILNACSRGSLAREIEGNGLFTWTLLNMWRSQLEAGRPLMIDDKLRPALEEQMTRKAKSLQRPPQCPGVQIDHALPFPLDIKIHPHWAANPGTVKATVISTESSLSPIVKVIECPICDKNNPEDQTFRCRECQRNYLCLIHRKKIQGRYCCEDCAEKFEEQARVEAEAQRKASEEKQREIERLEAEKKRLAEEQRKEQARQEAARKRQALKSKAAQAKTIADWEQLAREWDQMGEINEASRCRQEVAKIRELERKRNPANANKEAPWVNSLGMKFVPVPKTRVFFSIWETRVQDYEVFVKATQREWSKPSFSQGPTHPAVNVSWDDAKAYCEWLTQEERKKGRLGEEWTYRLPTDEEWSWAVSLPEEKGQTPKEKDMKIKDHYPWGTQWPPPKGAGNYCDETAHHKHPDWTYIEGYNDGYEYTSPVGSFTLNQYGLYDLGGNVWEWCEDFYDNDKDVRVLRGGSWFYYDPDLLLSSSRGCSTPGGRLDNRGFRCVLVAGSVS